MSAALITGASSGIGLVFAEELARQNKNLVLVARSGNKLEQIADKLQSESSIIVKTIPQDLTENNAVDRIFTQLETENITIDFLINNAGFGDYGLFSQTEWSKQEKMIQLNILALVELVHKYLPIMIDRGSGKIINVASIAAFQSMPYVSVYAATKAFVLNFTEALWAENQNTGVKFLALCPGPTKTEFFNQAGWQQFSANSSEYNNADDPLEVVKIALQDIDLPKSHSVPGQFLNQLVTNLPRFLPREILLKFVEQQFRPNS